MIEFETLYTAENEPVVILKNSMGAWEVIPPTEVAGFINAICADPYLSLAIIQVMDQKTEELNIIIPDKTDEEIGYTKYIHAGIGGEYACHLSCITQHDISSPVSDEYINFELAENDRVKAEWLLSRLDNAKPIRLLRGQQILVPFRTRHSGVVYSAIEITDADSIVLDINCNLSPDNMANNGSITLIVKGIDND